MAANAIKIIIAANTTVRYAWWYNKHRREEEDAMRTNLSVSWIFMISMIMVKSKWVRIIKEYEDTNVIIIIKEASQLLGDDNVEYGWAD